MEKEKKGGKYIFGVSGKTATLRIKADELMNQYLKEHPNTDVIIIAPQDEYIDRENKEQRYSSIFLGRTSKYKSEKDESLFNYHNGNVFLYLSKRKMIKLRNKHSKN